MTSQHNGNLNGNGIGGRGRPSRVHFTISLPGSEASSRAASPSPSSEKQSLRARDEFDDFMNNSSPGGRAMDVYEATLPWWRAATRRKLVHTVKWESDVIARMQEIIRTPWLDAYFVYSSSLGTHTFFMIFIPMFFFFGHKELGRELLLVLAFGVYLSSFVKDLICSPRPFAPPVTRLTIGTHHLEYGFPSTHTTNAISIALFIFAHVHRLASTINAETSEPLVSLGLYHLINVFLSIYAFSIVFGRIYTAMHSFTDCIMGFLLGTSIWWALSTWSGVAVSISSSNPLFTLYTFFSPSTSEQIIVHLGKGFGLLSLLETWIKTGGWSVPLILIPLCLLAVNQHPQPVDDCPCFEDAIAFMSVVLGALVGEWATGFFKIRFPDAGSVMPGSGWVNLGQGWARREALWTDTFIWWSAAGVKVVFGVIVIFTWRIVAKSLLHLILPPTFRLLARIFSLPNRRFYTPATDYTSVPSEFSGDGLHPIPSLIDLPSSAGIEIGGIGSGSGYKKLVGGREIKLRGANGVNGKVESNGVIVLNEDDEDQLDGTDATISRGKFKKDKDGETIKHYDADVLTKVIVYAGIAILSSEILPMAFDAFGWGLYSSYSA